MPLSKIFGDSAFRATVAVPGTNEATIILPYSTTPTQKAYKYAVRGMVLNPGDFVYVIPVSGTYVLLGGAAGGGGGGATLTAGDGISIANDVIRNTQGIEYIVGTQTAATAAWTGVSTDRTLKVGKIIAYYLPYSGNATAATLTLTMASGTSTGAIPILRAGTGTVTTQFSAGNVVVLIYDGTCWRVSAYYDSNTVPTGYCTTAAGTVGKSVTCNYGYRGDTNYFMCVFRYANTASNATLSISTYAPEPAPIYVNGERTSASNTFSAGVILFLYHNGAYYCYNDGRLPLLVNGVVTSVQDYVEGCGGLPTGGKTYDALVKNSDVSGDAIWSPLLYRGEDGGLCEVDEI